jgi:hypothetical protein
MNWKKSLVIGAGTGLSLAAANVADATIRVDDGKVYLTEFGKTVQVPATPALLDAIEKAGGGTIALPNDPAILMASGGGSSLGFGTAPDPATQRAIDEYLKQHPEATSNSKQTPAADRNAAPQKSSDGGIVIRHRDGNILLSSGGGSSLGFGVAPDPATQRAIDEYVKAHQQPCPETNAKDGEPTQQPKIVQPG